MRNLLLALMVMAACGDEKTPELVKPFDPTRFDGESCSINPDCKGGACLTDISGWPDGMCTTLNCEEGCNGESRACLPLLGTTTACLVRCESSDECRTGYFCDKLANEKVCLPLTVDGPVPGRAGSGCENNDDCNDGLECDLTQPGGYCLYPSCELCGEDGSCVDGAFCGQKCSETRDCRVGYVCRERGGDHPACVPAPAVTNSANYVTTATVLDITCNARNVGVDGDRIRWELDFNAPDSEGFVVVPVVASGLLEPFAIRGPEDLTIDLVKTYKHQNVRATELENLGTEPEGLFKTVSFDWPIQVPYAPQFASYAVPNGAYTMFVETDGEPPCLYVLAADQGSQLDLNIYLVGLENLSAATAPDDPDVQAVLSRVDVILAQVGVQLGQVRFFDPDEETVERYQIVRGFSDVRKLTALTPPPGPSLDEHLSVNLFWVQDIIVANTSGLLLGVSAGLPGAPGMHGNANNGLVFRVADIGFNNDFVAFIMTHEISHYLGLRHTTEIQNGLDSVDAADYDALVGLTDPLSDTPVCDNVLAKGSGCPDFNNLMFPAAPRPEDAGQAGTGLLSAQQGTTMRLNPLIKVQPMQR